MTVELVLPESSKVYPNALKSTLADLDESYFKAGEWCLLCSYGGPREDLILSTKLYVNQTDRLLRVGHSVRDRGLRYVMRKVVYEGTSLKLATEAYNRTVRYTP